MTAEIGFWVMHDRITWIPPEVTTDCDIKLIRKALTQITDDTVGNERTQTIIAAVTNYISACNGTLAAHERMNNILLLSLCIIFTAITMAAIFTPLSITSIVLIGLLTASLIIARMAMIATEANQYRQYKEHNKLKKYCNQARSYLSSIRFFSSEKNKTVELTALHTADNPQGNPEDLINNNPIFTPSLA